MYYMWSEYANLYKPLYLLYTKFCQDSWMRQKVLPRIYVLPSCAATISICESSVDCVTAKYMHTCMYPR